MFSFNGLQIACPDPKGLLIFFHGYGSSPSFLAPSAYALTLPHLFTWIPTSNTVCEQYHDGYQWFSLKEVNLYKFETIRSPLPLITERMDEASRHWTEVIQKKTETFSGPIFLAGFSQGAAFAYHLGLFGLPVAGVLGFSGFYKLQKSPLFRPPLFWCHGDKDEIISLQWVNEAENDFHHHHLSFEKHIIPGETHTISQQAISLGRRFLQKLFPL